MTHSFKKMALAFGLGAGCGTGGMAPATQSPATVDASIQQSMERLDALQIFQAGRLVTDLPAEATSCYGVPCRGSTWEQVYRDELARQAPRLARLTDITEQVAGRTDLQPVLEGGAEYAVAALNNLKVVDVPGLVEAQPANNPRCYNLPCEEDRAAADRENRLRVTRALTIADAARKAGL